MHFYVLLVSHSNLVNHVTQFMSATALLAEKQVILFYLQDFSSEDCINLPSLIWWRNYSTVAFPNSHYILRNKKGICGLVKNKWRLLNGVISCSIMFSNSYHLSFMLKVYSDIPIGHFRGMITTWLNEEAHNMEKLTGKSLTLIHWYTRSKGEVE